MIDRHDHHVHLYGCISASALWHRYKSRPELVETDRFRWFESEYQRLTGRSPQFRTWLNTDRFDLFRDGFEVRAACHFPEFQARFNLIIAAFPDRSDDAEVLNFVCHELQASGSTGADIRIFVPFDRSASQLRDYLDAMAKSCLDIRQQSGFGARLFCHLSRRSSLGQEQWRTIRQLAKGSEIFARAFVGSDFCEDEQAFEFGDFGWLMEDRMQHGPATPDWLYTCHVGEVCERIGIFTSLLRVMQVALAGFDRLGHASVVGIPAERWLGSKIVIDPVRFEHELQMIAGFDQALHAKLLTGSAVIRDRLQSNISHASLSGSIDQDLVDVIHDWQLHTIELLRLRKIYVESCPSSNLVLGDIPTSEMLPVHRFKREGTPLLIGSDDPGIFATTLATQHEMAQRNVVQIGY